MAMRPTDRRPTHPGGMLLEEWLKPMGLSQTDFAAALGVPFQRLNELILGKRGVTPDTALRLSRVLGTTPELWLNLQQAWDLWHAMQTPDAKAIAKLKPLKVPAG